MSPLRVPLLLLALPALLVALAPTSQNTLLLDRDAVAGGEIWRLWTGHWVHFSLSHLGWNLAVLLAAGIWLEQVRPGLLLRHVLLAGPLIGVAVLALEPGLQAYGGLSGLATGVVVLLALHRLRAAGPARWLWTGVLALVVLKCAGDLLHLGPGIARYGDSPVRTSSAAHAAGAAAALMHFAGGWLAGHGRGAPARPSALFADKMSAR